MNACRSHWKSAPLLGSSSSLLQSALPLLLFAFLCAPDAEAFHRDPVSLAKYTCEACTTDPARPVIIEERQRRAHERTKMHQKRLAGKGPRVDQKGQRQQQQQNSESQQLGMNAAEDETR